MTENIGCEKHITLLNDIDKLRSHGVSRYVSLPQLIVCGDQSAGKSSVLEAIAGIPFPTNDVFCTCFATEVILRHDAKENISVSIILGSGTSASEASDGNEFEINDAQVDDLPNIIDNAKMHMGIAGQPSALSRDVLRLEVSGPTQPHLTIVDLPGWIHSETKDQSAMNVTMVQSMIREYMSNRRSIILAIVSAKNDIANQTILNEARKVDPQGRRTLGIITKPDVLPAGSDSENAFLTLARNRDISFRLGWHVVKNRSYEERHASKAERDQIEYDFLSSGAWVSLARENLGINSLRDRLSKILFEQIQSELPTLLADIKSQLANCEHVLNRLGPARGQLDQQRSFLFHLSQEFHTVVRAAVNGSYDSAFFSNTLSVDNYRRRLRAVIQNLNVDFADEVRCRGQRRRIVEQLPSKETSDSEPEAITRSDYINEIEQFLRKTRGRELPGMFNPLTVGELFRDQASPWESIAMRHLKSTWSATKEFFASLLDHLTDERTAEALLTSVIDPMMDKILTDMRTNLEGIMKPYKTFHPITYNHYFTETVQKLKKARNEAELRHRMQNFRSRDGSTYLDLGHVTSLIHALSDVTEADMDRFACTEILDSMEAYYKVSMKTFVDAVAVYTVEGCLIAGASDLLSPSTVFKMNAETISRIAAETSENQTLRDETQKRLEALEKSLGILQTHVNRTSINKSLRLHSDPDLRSSMSETSIQAQAEDEAESDHSKDYVAPEEMDPIQFESVDPKGDKISAFPSTPPASPPAPTAAATSFNANSGGLDDWGAWGLKSKNPHSTKSTSTKKKRKKSGKTPAVFED